MVLEYRLNYNSTGEKRKFKIPKKRRLKIIDSSSWVENELNNQWCFKDYKCYYIIISKFGENDFQVSCSGAHVGTFTNLKAAKIAAMEFCDKINP